MASLLDHLASVGLDAGLAAAIWSGLIALAMVGCQQPAWRCLLARVANLGLLVIWPAVALLPLPRLPADALLRPFDLAPAATFDSGGLDPESRGPVASGGWQWHSSRLHEPSLNGGYRWARVGFLAYGVGLLACASWLGLGCALAWWLVCHAAEPREATRRVFDEVSSTSRGRRGPRLRVSSRIRCPVLLGGFRPTILIPPRLEHPVEVNPLRLGLVHELAHVERQDGVHSRLSAVAQAIWYVLPMVWWIGRQLRLDQEYLADRRAAEALGVHNSSYAKSLLDHTIGSKAEPALVSSSTFAPLGHSMLTNRVMMLVGCPYPIEDSLPMWYRRVALLLALCAGLALSTLSVTEPGAHDERENQPAAPRLRSVEFASITVDRAQGQEPGAPVILPIALPEQFDLKFEIQVRPIDLPLYAIAGYHVAPSISKALASEDHPEPPWLQVHVVRLKGHELIAEVDGEAATLRPRREPAHHDLTVHVPEGRSARIRRLVLSW